MMLKKWIATVGLFTLAVTTHAQEQSFEEMARVLERPDRASWQKPEEVIALLEPLKGKKVMDLGCGTGYFSFRLQNAGASVIAADIDERFLAYVDSARKAKGIAEKYLQTRKLPADDPMLQKREVDQVILVNTYHHLQDRVAYLGKIKKGLKQTGFLIIIDYFKKDLPIGPPVSEKLSSDDVVRELKMAGYSNFKVEETKLPFQYIVFAM